MPIVSAQTSADSARAVDDVNTLFGSGVITSGGFGGPVLKVGSVDDRTALFVGGRGGWVINRTFVIGGGGYGLIPLHSTGVGTQPDTTIDFGYGGLELEVILASTSVIHGSVLAHVGAGGFSVRRSFQDDMMDDDDRTLYSTAVFVFEPAVNVEVNLLPWLRFAAGGGYRFVSGIDATINGKTYDNSTVSGPFGVATVKFGIY
jgi:hypothetical protein